MPYRLNSFETKVNWVYDYGEQDEQDEQWAGWAMSRMSNEQDEQDKRDETDEFNDYYDEYYDEYTMSMRWLCDEYAMSIGAVQLLRNAHGGGGWPSVTLRDRGGGVGRALRNA